jgi:Cytochrome b5-like Heme/Steroid binding domain
MAQVQLVNVKAAVVLLSLVLLYYWAIRVPEEQLNRAAALYSAEQVRAHNTPEDLWIVLGDKVYDVTQFGWLIPTVSPGCLAFPPPCRDALRFACSVHCVVPSVSLPVSV